MSVKLPKGLKDHPLEKKISDWLTLNRAPIWSGAKLQVSALEWTAKSEAALKTAQQKEALLQGLEAIDREMKKELHGLKNIAKKTDTPLPAKMSRLLLLACDGSERFYRHAESILLENADRMVGCIISVDSVRMGEGFSKKSQPLKSLLINDRKVLEEFLIAAFS